MFLHDANPVVSTLVSGWDFQGFTGLISGPPVGILENASSLANVGSLQSQMGMGNGGIFDPLPSASPEFCPRLQPERGRLPAIQGRERMVQSELLYSYDWDLALETNHALIPVSE